MFLDLTNDRKEARTANRRYRGQTKPVFWAFVHGRAVVPARQSAVGFWLCGWAFILLWAEGLAGRDEL